MNQISKLPVRSPTKSHRLFPVRETDELEANVNRLISIAWGINNAQWA